MSGANSWLRGQRKSDLVDLAKEVGFENAQSLKKVDLEVSLDKYLSDNSTSFSNDPNLAGYYKAAGSPVKKESMKGEAEKALKVAKRRVTKVAEEVTPDSDATSTALVARTPRTQSLASRIALPATPADVAHAVDRGTIVARERIASLYKDSGITEATHATRDSLSTVTSVLFTVAAFELYKIRPEVLADRYAFTIPAVSFLGTSDYPVEIPDMFLLLTASFWSPALLWAATSFIIPSTFGYFYNLTLGSGGRRRVAASPEHVVDPLTFSIVKALISYVVYAQGMTFGGMVDLSSAERLNSAVYGGWKGMLVGCAITGLVSIYDAVLKK